MCLLSFVLLQLLDVPCATSPSGSPDIASRRVSLVRPPSTRGGGRVNGPPGGDAAMFPGAHIRAMLVHMQKLVLKC